VIRHSQLTEAFAARAIAYRVCAQSAPAVQLQEFGAGALDVGFADFGRFHRR
jgi:hypothetical protein